MPKLTIIREKTPGSETPIVNLAIVCPVSLKLVGLEQEPTQASVSKYSR